MSKSPFEVEAVQPDRARLLEKHKSDILDYCNNINQDESKANEIYNLFVTVLTNPPETPTAFINALFNKSMDWNTINHIYNNILNGTKKIITTFGFSLKSKSVSNALSERLSTQEYDREQAIRQIKTYKSDILNYCEKRYQDKDKAEKIYNLFYTTFTNPPETAAAFFNALFNESENKDTIEHIYNLILKGSTAIMEEFHFPYQRKTVYNALSRRLSPEVDNMKNAITQITKYKSDILNYCENLYTKAKANTIYNLFFTVLTHPPETPTAFINGLFNESMDWSTIEHIYKQILGGTEKILDEFRLTFEPKIVSDTLSDLLSTQSNDKKIEKYKSDILDYCENLYTKSKAKVIYDLFFTVLTKPPETAAGFLKALFSSSNLKAYALKRNDLPALEHIYNHILKGTTNIAAEFNLPFDSKSIFNALHRIKQQNIIKKKEKTNKIENHLSKRKSEISKLEEEEESLRKTRFEYDNDSLFLDDTSLFLSDYEGEIPAAPQSSLNEQDPLLNLVKKTKVSHLSFLSNTNKPRPDPSLDLIMDVLNTIKKKNNRPGDKDVFTMKK